MIYDEKRNTYTLTSGREFYANTSTIGIGLVEEEEFGDSFDYGADGSEHTRGYFLDETEKAWTPEERAELADEMIRRWTAFKEARTT